MSKRALYLVVAVLGLMAAVFGPSWGTAQPPAAAPAAAAPAAVAAPASGPKYTIVDTEGTNLLVVDNTANTLFYYTVDPGKTVGDELKLRGSIDLTEVGKPVIKPKHAAK